MKRTPWIASSLLVLFACGDDSAPVSPLLDGGPSFSASLGTCADPIVLEGRDEQTVSVSFDTTGGPPGRALLEVGFGCFFEPGEDVPQAVVAYRVPGVGRRSVRLSTDNDGTDPGFATTLVVRRGACGGPAPDPISSGCFDTVQDGPRASGTVGANGGETLYVVVAGNRSLVEAAGGVFSGRVRLDVTSMSGAVPELRSARVRVFAESPAQVELTVEGRDRDGDAVGAVASFLDASKAPVSWSPMGHGSSLGGPIGTFSDPPASFDPFSRTLVFAPPPTSPVATAWVHLIDAANGLSDRLSVDVLEARWRTAGEPCDDVTLVCRQELGCRDDACAAGPAIAAMCAAAERVVLTAPAEVATTVNRTGILPAAPGLAFPSCTDGSSAEHVIRVEVPSPIAADLVLTETSEDSGRIGLWIRRQCEDAASEVACSIQRDANRHRFVELRDVEPGEYAVAVDGFPFAGRDRHDESTYSLVISLRPVLPSNASCDPAGIANRCAEGACPAASARCP